MTHAELVARLPGEDRYLTAIQAKEYGLVDQVLERPATPKEKKD